MSRRKRSGKVYIVDTDEIECPICKKIFLHNPQSIYKTTKGKIKYYCSYTCWRKAGGDSGKFKI